MKKTSDLRATVACAIVIALAALLGGCVTVDTQLDHQTQVEDWRDEIIYQIIVDRFEDGDPNNNFNVDYRKPASYHGGDWQGIIDRLDYIESLGVTALWISPVVRNVEEDAGFASYHGYWTQNFIATNLHFGDLAKLQQLVKKCHARGIKVILDVVTNHIGQLFYYDINRNGQPDTVFFGGGGPGAGSQNGDVGSELRRSSEWDPEYDSRGVQGFTALGENGLAPIEWVEQPEINRTPPMPAEFQNPEWYNRKGRVTVWEGDGRESFEYRREQEILGDFPGGLKDLKTSRADVREALIKVFQYWIEAADFDGFRIDTIKHQETGFFEVFAPAMRRFAKQLGKDNFFMFGEAFDGDDALLGRYTQNEGVDSVFYFSAKYQVFNGVFGNSDPTINVQRLFEARDTEDEPGRPRYSRTPKTDGPTDADGQPLVPSQLLVQFIDNHDVSRFLFEFPDLAKLHNAMVYLFTIDGIPCLYYGTEQAFKGGPDPSNREDMWYSGFDETNDTFKFTQRLIKLRRELAPLRRGDVKFRWATEHNGTQSDAGLLAFERTYKGASVLVMINTEDAHETRSSFEGTAMQTGFVAGTTLVDRLSDQTFTVGANGTLDITVSPRDARILVAQ